MAPTIKKPKKKLYGAFFSGYNDGYEGVSPRPPKKTPARKAYTNGYSEGSQDVARWKKYGWTRKLTP